MPIFEYTCPACRTTRTELLKASERPESLPCTCGSVATLAVSTTAPVVIAGSRSSREGTRATVSDRAGFRVLEETSTFIIRQKGDSPDAVDWRCPNGHAWSDVYAARPTTAPCPECGEACSTLSGVPDVDWFTKQYGSAGYFDRGLGCQVNSLQHRRDIMAARGLVEYGEVGDIHEEYQRGESVRAKVEDEAMREMLRTYEHGPDAAALKQARDRGEVPDWNWAVETLGGLG